MIEPALFCRQHLLGEHNELHKLVGVINNHPHGPAIVDGQAEKGNIDTSLITDRHTQLVEEMERRGMNHNSPLSYEDELDKGSVDRQRSLRDLKQRCHDCKTRIEVESR